MHTHPVPCLHQNCDERFETSTDALQHAIDINHSTRGLFFCPLPTCRSSVARKPLCLSKAKSHFRIHVRRGHIGVSDELVPQPVETLTFRGKLPLFWDMIQCVGVDLADEDEGNDSSEALVNDTELLDPKLYDDAEPTASGSDEKEGDKFELLFPEHRSSCDLDWGVLSEKHRLHILQHNTGLWEGM
ncbi:hypothetical protein CEP54_015184 [Fusarium duplospermum]|uniref:C2H2-type domain-containing protein n=1 Tax=Fusarium duplospermum TaxID=1325734 RepID=A0A428NR05_9HYPO|nr:hypothetical protein CEP54_015184 [Fusarium duplospermum]